MRDPALALLIVLGLAWLLDWFISQSPPREPAPPPRPATPSRKDETKPAEESNPVNQRPAQLRRDWLRLKRHQRR